MLSITMMIIKALPGTYLELLSAVSHPTPTSSPETSDVRLKKQVVMRLMLTPLTITMLTNTGTPSGKQKPTLPRTSLPQTQVSFSNILSDGAVFSSKISPKKSFHNKVSFSEHYRSAATNPGKK